MLSLSLLIQVKSARSGCERQQDINRQLALENTDKEPQFTAAKEELRRLVTEAQDIKADYDSGYDELSKSYTCTSISFLIRNQWKYRKHDFVPLI